MAGRQTIRQKSKQERVGEKLKKGTKTKEHPQSMRCPYCGAPMVIRPAEEIYRRKTNAERLLVCSRYPECNTYAQFIPGTDELMGNPADPALRRLRDHAHRSFDRVWKKGYMSRDDAYHWMADFLGLRRDQAHIGRFDTYRCRRVISKCEALRRLREQQKDA